MNAFLQEYWVWIVAALVVVAIIALLRNLVPRERYPYERRKRLVTKSEYLFFQQLRAAVDDDWEIFAMVWIADLIRVTSGARNYRSWLNKILAKHVEASVRQARRSVSNCNLAQYASFAQTLSQNRAAVSGTTGGSLGTFAFPESAGGATGTTAAAAEEEEEEDLYS